MIAFIYIISYAIELPGSRSLRTSPQKALVAPTVFCEVMLKVYLNPASRLDTVILVVSTLLIETGTGLLIMNSSSNV